MTRLTSIEKGGFYALPPEHLPALASLFAPVPSGTQGKLLDPCAGAGEALDYLAQAWNLKPYANEIEDDRAAACQAKFGPLQAVHGDMYQLKASPQAFLGVWTNPPYSWDRTGDEKRREFAMLKHSLKWVQPEGYLLWCVYGHHVTLDAASWLARHSQQIDVWKLPGLHLGEYSQVVVVAKIGRGADDPARTALQIVQAGKVGMWPELTVQPVPCYEFPAALPRKTFLFAPKVISPDLALQFVQNEGVQFSTAIQDLVTPEKPPEQVHPVVQPRGGQLALILAAGLFNSLVLENGMGGRMAVRSTVESVERQIAGDTSVDEDNPDTTEREVYRTQSVVTITLLGNDGSVQDISGDGPIASFIKTHKATLLAYLDQHFTPLYTFDYSRLKALLSRSKGGKLFTTQKHVIAACYTALQQRRSLILCGEPGSGKSAMGAAVAAALLPYMQPGQVTVIMCPPHLVEKWEREVKEAYAPAYVKILRNVEDVCTFMDRAAQNTPNILNVGILSRETAKLGEGWDVAVCWRKVRHPLWAYGAPRPTDDYGREVDGDRVLTIEVPLCPTCNAPVVEGQDQSHKARRGQRYEKGAKPQPLSSTSVPDVVSKAWLKRIPHFCPKCGGALWMKARTFSKGKKVGDNPKNPRVPLAEFIAKRYGDRLYLLLVDELHECKSASTDQGEAMSILANAATKTLGLTGTLYGGAASSLYSIECLFNPRVQRKYPWGRGMNKWVRDMGTLERTVEYKPTYDKAGVYSGKRRVEQKPKEAPGCSPLLVSEIIDHCVFVGLLDIGKKMPDFEEIPVAIQPDPDVQSAYYEAKQVLGKYLFQCKMEGDASALGMYLQTLLSWPSAPYRTETCIHRKRLDRDSDLFLEMPVHTIPGLSEDRIYAKEQWLIDTVREELAQGRGVGIFVRQTGERDIQPRLVKLLQEHVPMARPYILKGSVKADLREGLLNEQVKAGTNVLICNPILVQTGLDLCDFQSLIFYEVMYSLPIMAQASRRAWRLIQDKPCRVYYAYYQDLMENQAVELVGRKQQAAALLYGENTSGGLSALNGDDGGNLLAALAQEIDGDKTVADLRALFARHATQTDPAESSWLGATEDTENVPAEAQTMLETTSTPANEPSQSVVSKSRNLLAALVRPIKRRRKVQLSDVPTDDLPLYAPVRLIPQLGSATGQIRTLQYSLLEPGESVEVVIPTPKPKTTTPIAVQLTLAL